MWKDICTQAECFLKEHGFSSPPLPPDQALAARKLEVTQLSLDDLLVKANLPPKEHKKIQAMLDVEERAVTFRAGLPMQQRNWGALHEIGHEFLPWQRELLCFCPLLWLPVNLQEQFEAEADIFAAEAFFFGDQFERYASQGDWSLATARDLAEKVYGTSLHATFHHYVERSAVPACLLVWRPATPKGDVWLPQSVSLHYYVPSKTFRGHIDPGQIADPEEVVSKLFNDPSIEGIVRHDMVFKTKSGDELVASAESFCNSYAVFTLISQPRSPSKVVPAASILKSQ